MLSVISTPASRLTTMRDVVADVPWPAERDGMKEPQRGNRGGDRTGRQVPVLWLQHCRLGDRPGAPNYYCLARGMSAHWLGRSGLWRLSWRVQKRSRRSGD
jgi:hypothetical protein